MLKKFKLLLLALCILFALGATTASAEVVSGSCGDNVNWSYNTESFVFTVSGTGAMYDYKMWNIPWSSYLRGSDAMRTIVIEEGVTHIGNNAFRENPLLKAVTMPNSLVSIGELVFYDSSLSSVNFGNSLVSIGANAFYSTEVEEIILPATVESVGNSAFRYCMELKRLEIPDSVTTIGSYAFDVCNELTHVSIGSGIEEIGGYAFMNCDKLKNVYIKSLESWCNIDFENSDSNPLVKGGNLYLDSVLVTEIELPDGTDVIKPYAFVGAKGIKNVKIPQGISEIGENAFKNTGIEKIEIPSSVETVGGAAFYGCKSLNEVTIKNGVKVIDYDAFYDCDALTSITIPDSVTSVGAACFSGCENLKEAHLGMGVTECSLNAFRNCGNLTDIIVDENNTTYRSIDGVLYTKDEKTLLVCPPGKIEVSIGKGTTKIEDYAFVNNAKIKSINLPCEVNEIGGYAFSGCSALENITIPLATKEIRESAFNKCKAITLVYYEGDREDWKNINISPYYNWFLTEKSIYYMADMLNAWVLDGVLTVKTQNVPEDGIVVIKTTSGDAVTACIKKGNVDETIVLPDGEVAIKVFMWKSINSMQPLSDTVNIE